MRDFSHHCPSHRHFHHPWGPTRGRNGMVAVLVVGHLIGACVLVHVIGHLARHHDDCDCHPHLGHDGPGVALAPYHRHFVHSHTACGCGHHGDDDAQAATEAAES